MKRQLQKQAKHYVEPVKKLESVTLPIAQEPSRNPPHELRDQLYKEYDLQRQKSQESFDKAVMTISGGALGLSITFVKDVLGGNTLHDSPLLLIAWGVWTASLLCTFISFLVSAKAFERAMKQVREDDIFRKDLAIGGIYGKSIDPLNAIAAFLCLMGIVCMAFFVYATMPR